MSEQSPTSLPMDKLQWILDAAAERNAQDPVAFAVSDLTSFTDIMLLLSGRSDRQVRAIADGIEEALGQRGEKLLGVEGRDGGRWVLLDCDDVVVHVFDQETRDEYALDRLWSDATILVDGREAATPAPQGQA